MREFTVRAPDDLAAWVDEEARRQGVAAVEVWRTAMAVYRAGGACAQLEVRIERCEKKLGIKPAA